MKKKILSMALALVMCLSLLPATALAADYVRPDIPDVFQGDGLYITATPLALDADKYHIMLANQFGDGVIPVSTEVEVRDAEGYLVSTENRYLILKADGTIITPEVDAARMESFSDGLAAYYDAETKRFGYVDTNGKAAIPAQYMSACPFSDGLAYVSTVEGDYYYIDKTGKKVLGPYDDGTVYRGGFSNGLARFDGRLNDKHFVGYIDKSGKPAITLYYGEYIDWDEMRDKYLQIEVSQSSTQTLTSDFSEGYAILKDERGGKTYASYVVIDTEGNEVLTIKGTAPYAVDDISLVHDGTIVVEYDHTEGGSGYTTILDINGNERWRTDYLSGSYDSGVIPFGNRVVDKRGKAVMPDLRAFMPRDMAALYGEAGSIDLSYSARSRNDFSDGLCIMYVDLVRGGMIYLATWYYVLEVHEGTYTGPGTVYNAATGTVSDGGASAPSTPTTPATPTQPEAAQPSTWAVDAVNQAKAAGIVPEALQSGYTTPITRAEYCALATALYESMKGEITERKTFSDTTDPNVEKMAAIGVVDGVGNNMFSPNSKLTREQAATMLSRLAEALGKPFAETAPTFADNDSISDWAFAAVGKVQANGIMNGVGNNNFSPLTDYTREQSIITMVRMMEHAK